MIVKNGFLAALFLTSVITDTSAQLFTPPHYPQNFFQWPVGTTPGLVANFGELRPNHYHMGLDCKTDQRENLPIYAAADGFVAKVSIDGTGFGRAIYIQHPNGLTTLYAHLNLFYPELEEEVKRQQYRAKKWKLAMEMPAGQFKVKKGQFIAYSGNTGGSQGPHLHFEIRDTKTDQVLNPLLFGFNIADQVPPDISRLAMYDRSSSTYEQTPRLLPVKKINGVYHPAQQTIYTESRQVSFGITASDRISGSGNPNGIYRAELWLDDHWISGFEMDSVSYDETRYLNAHIDFKLRSHGGPFVQHLSPLPGYTDGIYRCAHMQDGVIRLKDDQKHRVRIIVYDTHENRSVVEFDIQKTRQAPIPSAGRRQSLLFKPNEINVYENDQVWLYLPEKAIYDSFHFQYSRLSAGGRTIHRIQGNDVPVQEYFKMRIREKWEMADTGHIIMKVTTLQKVKYAKAIYQNGWYEAAFRDFGDYELVLDQTPPVVSPLWGFRDRVDASHMSRIGFAVTDNCKEIASFAGLLDGEWLLFSNDKGTHQIYNMDEHCGPGEHFLEIVVKDLAGNTTRKSYRFYR